MINRPTIIPLVYLFLPLAIFLIIRLFRSLAILQQKEYRLDRLIVFYRSKPGIKEFFRLFPRVNDFSYYGFKRPKLTFRILLHLLIQALFLFYLFFILKSLIVLIIYYGCIPLLILLINLPFEWFKDFYTISLLRKVYFKLKARNPLIIGITGSYGKTSTKLLCYQLLQEQYSCLVTPNSLNTPLAIAKFILKNFQRQEILILEYAAYRRGEIAFLTNFIKPDYVLITGLTNQHLALFGSKENIMKAKGELITGARKKAIVIISGNQGSKEILKSSEHSSKKLFDASQITKKDLKDISLDEMGRLQFLYQQILVKTKLIGRFYLENIALALQLATLLKINKEKIIQTLQTFKTNERFIQSTLTKSGALVIDDGLTANPDGFEKVLELIAELKKEKKVSLIFSGIVDLGENEGIIHHQLASQSKGIIDEVFYTGENGLEQFKKVFLQNLINNQKLILLKLGKFSNNDILLIEGKIPAIYLKKIKNV